MTSVTSDPSFSFQRKHIQEDQSGAGERGRGARGHSSVPEESVLTEVAVLVAQPRSAITEMMIDRF